MARAGICYIVGAGSFDETIAPGPRDFVIAADGGYQHLADAGMRVDLLLGDFDSIAEMPEGIEVRRFAPEKDDTDMMLAVKAGLELGFSRFALYGGLGGRLDHTLANAQVLCYLSQRGALGFLVGEGMVLTALTDSGITLAGGRGIISVFCMGDLAEGVALLGLKFPLAEATLTSNVPLGVSNEFMGGPARISVRKGTLLALWYERGFLPNVAFDLCKIL